ncbi:MAG TPA: rhomboid family intramembrane serine protease [Gammaproteobacteria bacterium]|jgi:membrane associated rhomboid family serine protease|nr:rhomboid family intramembrane serine protease [Gammaproteobacteria bacterium]
MFSRLPPATAALLAANIIIYLLQQLTGVGMILHFALWPLGPDHVLGVTAQGSAVSAGFRIWQVVTYGFLHGGLQHIFFNMLALYMFGGPIELTFGRRAYVLYYFVCLIVAAGAQLGVVHFMTGGFYPTLGASGAIFGLLLAYGMLYPHQRIMLLIPPIPMPAWLFVGGYVVLELVLGVTGTQAGVAHFAHLGGALAGFVMITYWRGKLPIKPRRRLLR